MSHSPNQRISNISFHKTNAFLSKPFIFAKAGSTKQLLKEKKKNDLDLNINEKKKSAPLFDSTFSFFYTYPVFYVIFFPFVFLNYLDVKYFFFFFLGK